MPGKMAAADFEFGPQIGTGAFSKVVVGLYKPTGVRYAVKFISKRSILDAPTDEERTRMAEVARRETRMLLICDHPNIVKFHASMQTTEDLLYVTELCEGGELLKHIERWGHIPLEAARHAIAELFSAVFYLHHGEKKCSASPSGPVRKTLTVIHRDIKPENVMLSADKHLRLIDFGTAVVCQSANDKAAGEETDSGRAKTFCGTTYYMSPELLESSYTCCASDYWGCGCVLYLMLVGQRPFDAPTQYLLIKTILEKEPEFPDDIDPDARDLIRKLLVKDPKARIGMKEVKCHPFLASVNLSTVANQNVADFWLRETPWIDEAGISACMTCQRPFGILRSKGLCRSCGRITCNSCVANLRIIPGARWKAPQNVCTLCAGSLNGAPVS
ncbi:protein kinase, putative [Leishmania tarentolae]|uniref:non-specific serine/threonine protein kinase n=1 Tax=Leishmania tarentolae TaxID=5689 RepID=A0A640KDS7_LEITA|nr:protein kinase, putative [Leishmania tarentolae]